MAENVALYTLGTQYVALLDKLQGADFDPQTIADTIESTGIEDDIERKVEAYEMVARNLEAFVPAIEIEVARLVALKLQRQATAQALRDRVLKFMLDTGLQRVIAPRFTVSVRDNPERVDIFDTRQIPSAYMRQPVAPPAAPDKTAIKAALKAGTDVPGAKLERGKRLDIK